MPNVVTPWIGRRAAVAGLSAAGVSVFLPRLLRAQSEPVPTPRQTEGPFYPRDWTGDIDNDLVVVKGEAAKAIGQIIYVQGRVLDLTAKPMIGAAIEIWQCDSQGIYRHPRDEGRDRRRDSGFQGYGRTVSDAGGRYQFRTIRPVAYGPRTPHIHFKIALPSGSGLITQMYILGEPMNGQDGVLNRIASPRQRDSVIVRLDTYDRVESGALLGTFDIVLG